MRMPRLKAIKGTITATKIPHPPETLKIAADSMDAAV
jgi:hypothetical protein